jgi:hypothetical protein
MDQAFRNLVGLASTSGRRRAAPRRWRPLPGARRAGPARTGAAADIVVLARGTGCASSACSWRGGGRCRGRLRRRWKRRTGWPDLMARDGELYAGLARGCGGRHRRRCSPSRAAVPTRRQPTEPT